MMNAAYTVFPEIADASTPKVSVLPVLMGLSAHVTVRVGKALRGNIGLDEGQDFMNAAARGVD